jgi:hypothetical protein
MVILRRNTIFSCLRSPAKSDERLSLKGYARTSAATPQNLAKIKTKIAIHQCVKTIALAFQSNVLTITVSFALHHHYSCSNINVANDCVFPLCRLTKLDDSSNNTVHGENTNRNTCQRRDAPRCTLNKVGRREGKYLLVAEHG